MALTPPSLLRAGGRNGLARGERRDPIGLAVSALNKIAQSDVLDRVGLRRQAEQTVYTATRHGFRSLTAASRQFQRLGGASAGTRAPSAQPTGVFDLTPSEDEQMLVEVVATLAEEVLRPAAAAADAACVAPADVLAAGLEVGLPSLGVPEALGGIVEERSTVAGALVAEALSHGDMGLAVASLAPGAVATAIGMWGSQQQQQTYLPAFTGEGTDPSDAGVPAAALAIAEPQVLFDPLRPSTTARREGDQIVLDGTKSAVVRGTEAELFVVGASLEDAPILVLLESSTDGLAIEADPSMGVRAAGLTRLRLEGARVPADAILGDTDGTAYAECVRLSRLTWCALAVGTAQAVLDYVKPYVNERVAFGEPVSHRQSVAFMVADMAIEVQAMRLLTWRAASRAAQGKDIARDVALARRLCTEKGMKIGLDGVQLLGGHGFVKEHPVERWYRDLRAIGVMEGAVLI